MLKIASWNINSVRLRLPIVRRLIEEEAPDVLCLQEIKCVEEQFPHAAFHELGYEHIAVHGQKGYHGVATVSRVPFAQSSRGMTGRTMARRVTWASRSAGRETEIIVENVYVPAGGDVPDRAVNAKFGQKLDFVERMARWAERIDRPTLIVGDFNIAPLECDVWSHKQLLKVVSHTPIEVEGLERFRDAHGWTDIGRAHVPAPGRCYTWWSYRNPNWQTNDKGRRLDHMWASPDLARQAVSHRVLEEARNWERPSDHVPLITGFAL